MARWLELAEMSNFKARKDFYLAPEVETAAVEEENTPIRGTIIEYEGL